MARRYFSERGVEVIPSAVRIARRDIGENHGGQGAGPVQLLAPTLEVSLVGELAQHVLERDAVAAFEPERAGDLADPHLAGLHADEAEQVLLGGERTLPGALSLGQGISRLPASSCERRRGPHSGQRPPFRRASSSLDSARRWQRSSSSGLTSSGPG